VVQERISGVHVFKGEWGGRGVKVRVTLFEVVVVVQDGMMTWRVDVVFRSGGGV